MSVNQRHGTVDLVDRKATRRLQYLAGELLQIRQPGRDLGPTIQRG